MKSKLHVRRVNPSVPSETTECEIEVTDQKVTGVKLLTEPNHYFLPEIGWPIKAKYNDDASPNTKSLQYWCERRASHQVKLPNEPESAYRHIENMMQLGDVLGCGQVE